MKITTRSRGLIWIDAEPILRVERARCLKLKSQLEKSGEQLKKFEQETKAAFSRWLSSTFGKELTLLRELNAKGEELSSLMDEVEEAMDMMGCPEKVAYAAVMERRSRPPLEQEDTSRCACGDPDCPGNRSPGDRPDERSAGSAEQARQDEKGEEEALEREFRRMFGPPPKNPFERGLYEATYQMFRAQFGLGSSGEGEDGSEDEYNRERESGRQGSKKASAPPASPSDSRLKELYRTLARKLHPDINLDLSAEERKLWYQVQEAYNQKDLERLESLAAFGLNSDEGLQTIRQVSAIRAIYSGLLGQKRGLDRELRAAKKDPAWGFDRIQANEIRLAGLRRRIQGEMNEEAQEAQCEINRMESVIARWAKPATPRRSKKESSSRPRSGRGRKEAVSLREDMDRYTGFKTEKW